MSHLIDTKELLVYDRLEGKGEVVAFSTTRLGGHSAGQYASFNCSPYCGDDPEDVRYNQSHLYGLLPVRPRELVIPHQVHGSEVRVVDEAYVQASPEQRRQWLQGVDALVSRLPGYCLCVSTADCVPLVFYDARTHAVGVAHAGWRGTVARIATKTLQTMQEAYGTHPGDIRVCIGPSISLEAFEVGVEVYEAFRQAHFPMERVARWYKPHAKWHIDLWEANRWLLQSSGVCTEHIELSGVCTYLQCDDFFSARRMGTASGRMLTGIMWNKENNNL